MRKNITAISALSLAAIILLFVFSSCGISAGTVTQENEQSAVPDTEVPSPASAKPKKIPVVLDTVEKVGKLPDIYTESIIKNELLFKATETTDGFLLVPEREEGKTHIDKYDKSGALLWSKEYGLMPADSYQTYTVALAPDGGFIVGIEASDYHRDDGSLTDYDSVIAKFDKDGNMLWKTPYKRNGGESYPFDNIFCLPGGDIITIGSKTIPETKAAETGSARWDLYLSKLDKEGNLIDERYYGGTDLEWIDDAAFIDGHGIAALVSTQSNNGTFYVSNEEDSGSVLVMLDTGLDIKWQRALLGTEYYEGLYIFGNNIFTTHSLYGSADTLKSFKLQIFSTDGDEILLKDFSPDSVYFVPGSSNGVMLQFPDKLVKLDAGGNQIFEMPFSAGNAQKIIEYDNYFLVLSNVANELPTPGFIEPPWCSNEDVYSGYDYSGNLLWRYAIDTTPEYMKDYDPEHEDEWFEKYFSDYIG